MSRTALKISGPIAVSLLTMAAALGSSDPQNSDASQWSGSDAYRILHNSPWTKTVKVSHSERNPFSNTGPDAGNSPNNTGVGSMPRMGGMGRRGMGGGGTYGGSTSGRGSKPPASDSTSSSAQVTVQWQSALPVRLAAAKNAGEDPSASASQPSNEYIVAVIGLPLVDIGGRAANADSSPTTDQEETERLQDRLKNAVSLLRSGHDPLTPSKVELDQGKDGRILFHFPKTDPITAKDKAVEFRLAADGTKFQKKFTLKEMEYKGQLEL